MLQLQIWMQLTMLMLLMEIMLSSNTRTGAAFTNWHACHLFGGYEQQDVQEFFAYCLDALHEDLNRVVRRPWCGSFQLIFKRCLRAILGGRHQDAISASLAPLGQKQHCVMHL